ncbi:MAG: SRPBCC family protein [Burkholderiales bacterium]|nr:SRPBCC family protein [Pseudomonadota bacterium]
MKKLFAALLLVAPLAAPIVAEAAKPAKLHVGESVEIAAKPEVVWDKIKDFNGLGTWHPAVAKSEIVEGTNNKKGAVRVLTLQDGGTIKEKLLSHRGKSFKYTILEGVLPVSDYTSKVAVKPGKNGGSTVEWSGDFKRKSADANPPQGQDDATATKTMTTVYRAGLDNLKKVVANNR